MNWIDVKLYILVRRKKGCHKDRVYRIIHVDVPARTFNIISGNGRVTRHCLPEKYDIATTK